MTGLRCTILRHGGHSQYLECIVSACVSKEGELLEKAALEKIENSIFEFDPQERNISNTNCLQRKIKNNGSTSQKKECDDEPRLTDAENSPGTSDKNGENRLSEE